MRRLFSKFARGWPGAACGRLRLVTRIRNEWLLGNWRAVLNAIELAWRRDARSGLESRIEEIEHLPAVDWPMSRNEDELASHRHDVLVFASPFLWGEQLMKTHLERS